MSMKLPIALVAGLLYLMGTLALVYGVTQSRTDPYAPLDYHSPQVVLNPIVRPGGKLSVDAYKCNKTDAPVSVAAVNGTPYLVNLDTQEIIPRPGPGLEAYVRPPGCPLLHFENPLPNLPPGRYELRGVEVATGSKGQAQREAWNTAEFCVTDANGEGC